MKNIDYVQEIRKELESEGHLPHQPINGERRELGIDQTEVVRKSHFPDKYMPPVMKALCEKIDSIYKAPKDLTRVSALATMAGLVQEAADVVISYGRFPVSLYTFVVGHSGERKTTVDGVLTHPQREHERRQYVKFLDAVTKQELEESDNENGKKNEKPVYYGSVVDDATVQGIQRILENRHSVIINTSEGAVILCGYSMTPENKMATAGSYSALWDGQPLVNSRAGKGQRYFQNKRVSQALMAQDNVFRGFFTDSAFKEQGLINRYLFCKPESTIGYRPFNEELVFETEAYLEYHKHVTGILNRLSGQRDEWQKNYETEIEVAGESKDTWRPGECRLGELHLSDRANRLFRDFYNEIEDRLKPENDLAEIKGYAARIPEQALRIAGVLILFFYGCDLTKKIGEKSMRAGIEIARFFLDEYKLLSEITVVDEILIDAEQLKQWIKKNTIQNDAGRFVYSSQILTHGPMPARRKDRLEKLVDELKSIDFIADVDEMKLEGTLRKKVWQVKDLC